MTSIFISSLCSPIEMYLIDSNDTAIPIGTLMSNTHLHPKVAVIAPPKTIPAAKPEPVAAVCLGRDFLLYLQERLWLELIIP